MKDPVEKIEWIDASLLLGNSYNPNVVLSTELNSLARNILEYGWIQPVIVTQQMIIVDGFHRVQLSLDNEKIYKKYKGQVPCVVFAIARDKAMILTVRMNRAKGNHVAWRMAEMVKELIDYFGYEPRALAKAIGGTKAEIDLLYTEGVFEKKDIANYKYSKSWYPSLVEDVDADNK